MPLSVEPLTLEFQGTRWVRRAASPSDLRQANEWAPLEGWNWFQIRNRFRDVFVLARLDTDTVGIISAGLPRPRILPSGNYYRWEYFRRAPEFAGLQLGELGFAAVCWRARELDAEAVVFAALESRKAYFEYLGCRHGRPFGWKCQSDLVPFVVPPDLVEAQAGMFDAAAVLEEQS